MLVLVLLLELEPALFWTVPVVTRWLRLAVVVTSGLATGTFDWFCLARRALHLCGKEWTERDGFLQVS